MRIVSLVPHATELLYALGLGDSVVGITHECDYPPETAGVRRITRDVLPAGLSAAEIDAAVRERTEKGEAIYLLDEDALADLEPDLIVTQELCPVCAVSYDEVKEVAEKLDPCPEVIALDPKTFGETMGDIRTLAQATDAKDAGVDLVNLRRLPRLPRVRTRGKAQGPVRGSQVHSQPQLDGIQPVRTLNLAPAEVHDVAPRRPNK